mmetsp:Transcript_22613/g.70776  ORF Transcript_22613/g.70776 Transcript_22613/m.70776 type:complete len:1626 (+) Transcript_22613:579-5456(+)
MYVQSHLNPMAKQSALLMSMGPSIACTSVRLALPLLALNLQRTGLHLCLVFVCNRNISPAASIRCVPCALAWGCSILVGGSDGCAVFYSLDGTVQQRFGCNPRIDATGSGSHLMREITAAAFNSTGETAVIGSWNHFCLFTYSLRQSLWEEAKPRQVTNMQAVTAVAWRQDGTRLAVGSLFGAVDAFDVCIRRFRYKGHFELTYSSPSQVIVKRLNTGIRIVLKSIHGYEIVKVNIFQERYVIANTLDNRSRAESLLLGDLITYKLSEITWSNGGTEKFVFDNPSYCIIYRSGELIIVEYGRNEVIGTVRTENISGHLISLRMVESSMRSPPTVAGIVSQTGKSSPPSTKIAYLIDAHTIGIKDLTSNGSTSLTHDSRIDWLELNGNGTALLFRDRHRRLNLFKVATQSRITLVDYCTYVQWVPDSDVVVAQSRKNLCVWYNINAPDQVTSHQISGDVENVERRSGYTEVLVDEKHSMATYLLDESLIEFDRAVDATHFGSAGEILESLDFSPETEGLWNKLDRIAHSCNDFRISGRCSAAVGNVARSRYLRKLDKLLSTSQIHLDDYRIRTRCLLLAKAVVDAEAVVVSQGHIVEAVAMHLWLHEFERAIQVSKNRGLASVRAMRRALCQYFLNSRQEARAAEFTSSEDPPNDAALLYLRGGLPCYAARLAKRSHLSNSPTSIERTALSLTSQGLYELAGDLLKIIEQHQRAMECYVDGAAFRKAVDLARSYFPGRVVELHEAWGDHLLSIDAVEMAVNHYIEANAVIKAIEALMASRQWIKAAQMLDGKSADVARPYQLQLGYHYEVCGDVTSAEKWYVVAGAPERAVTMYISRDQCEHASRIASTFCDRKRLHMLCVSQAQNLESLGRLKDAERLYIAIDEADMAINMYKKYRKYDEMVALVEQHRSDLVDETHKYLAQHLEAEGNLRRAEYHYCEASEWLSAVNMYRANDMWPEAIRVAEVHGGTNASKRVAYAWALALGGDSGARLLSQRDLVGPAIDFAIESGAFDHAFDLATSVCPAKLPEVHLKHALYLEDEEKYREAEAEFIKASKPREAIDMYIHQQAWDNALAIATKYDPSAVSDVDAAHARVEQDAGRLQRAEELYVSAGKPELALAMYRDASLWSAALALAERHLPHEVTEISLAMTQACAEGKGTTKSEIIALGQQWENRGEWTRAVEAYLGGSEASISAHDLEGIWGAALSVARTRLASDARDRVFRDVTARLREIGSYELAAELLYEQNRRDEGVLCALEGECWSKAREIAKGIPTLESKVEDACRAARLRAEGSDSALLLGGDMTALDALAKRKEWKSLWLLADRQRIQTDRLTSYACRQAIDVLDSQGDGPKALEIFLERTDVGVPMHGDVCQKISIAILCQDREQDSNHSTTLLPCVAQCRELLLRLCEANSCSTGNFVPNEEDSISRLFFTVHYYSIYLRSLHHGIQAIGLKAVVTLLHYTDIIPSDKVFYLAGTLARQLGQTNLAFLLLNRYIDITEAMEDCNPSIIDNFDFAVATNVPHQIKLPEKQHVADLNAREETRDWVLSLCVDKSVDQQLPSAAEALGTNYAGLYAYDLPRCVVTGYPIQSWEMLEINNYVANKVDWNAFVRATKTCPWTGQPQGPLY